MAISLKKNKRWRLVGIEEGAEYLGISRWLFRDMIIAGKIPVIRYSGKTGTNLRGCRVDLDDLDKFIEEGKKVKQA